MNTIIFILTAGISFAAMEGVSYLAHRYVYHGIGWRFHESHHRRRKGIFEKNDVFPAFFAVSTMAVIFASLNIAEIAFLLPVGIGVSLYGITYFFIHDIYIHGRSRRLRFRIPMLREMRKAHAIHHRYGREPYGLLLYRRGEAFKREADADEDKQV